MSKPAIHTIDSRPLEWTKQAALIVGASLLVALCAQITLPLPTPVPLTLQNFGVLLVALLLGPRRGFAALALYLIEGASGLPVFNPVGPIGIARFMGATGGFLIAYPVVAFITGWIYERSPKSFVSAAFSALRADSLPLVGISLGPLLVRIRRSNQNHDGRSSRQPVES
jgi:biotin transport system substrate-specific component